MYFSGYIQACLPPIYKYKQKKYMYLVHQVHAYFFAYI